MSGSVHQDAKTGRWLISIYWEGKQWRFFRHPKTGEAFFARQQAEKQLAKIRTEIDEKTFNPRFWQQRSPMSVREYSRIWLSSIQVSPNTRRDYSNSIRNFIVPFFQDESIKEIKHAHLVNFLGRIKRSDKGKYNVMGCLKAMLRYAWRNEDIEKVPPFPRLSFQNPEIKYLTLDQQEKVLAAIAPHDQPIFKFLMEYGVRPGEAMALKKDCISDQVIVIRRSFSSSLPEIREVTKSKQIRTLQITPYCRSILDSMTAHLGEFVFVRSNGEHYTSKVINRIWRNACNQIGISIKLYNGTRHSLGCQLLDQGQTLDLVRDILGHSNQAMTLRYAMRSAGRKVEALNQRRVVPFSNHSVSDKAGNDK